jgi:hypothetical protein
MAATPIELPMVLTVHVHPTPGVHVRIDPETGNIIMRHPRQSYVIIIDPDRGKAVMIDPVTHVVTPVDLETMQRYGWIDVRLERSPGQVAPIYLNVLAIPVLVIPALTIPALSIPFLNGAQ